MLELLNHNCKQTKNVTSHTLSGADKVNGCRVPTLVQWRISVYWRTEALSPEGSPMDLFVSSTAATILLVI